MPSLQALYTVFLSSFFYSLHASATLVNVTVDDSSNDITYSPVGEWSIGNSCSMCTAHPDAAETKDGTWHDISFFAGGSEADPQTASLQFNGSAVYVFCILFNSLVNSTGNSDLTFFIDGQSVDQFHFTPSGDQSYEYNVPVFSSGSMLPGFHTVQVQNGLAGGRQSLILLDYIMYSHEFPDPPNHPLPSSSSSAAAGPTSPISDSPPPSMTPPTSSPMSTHKHTIAIATSCSVGAAVCILIGIGMVVYLRKHRLHRREHSLIPTPFSSNGLTQHVSTINTRPFPGLTDANALAWPNSDSAEIVHSVSSTSPLPPTSTTPVPRSGEDAPPPYWAPRNS